jgi:EpsI family protein
VLQTGIDKQREQLQAPPNFTPTAASTGGIRVWIILALALAAALIYWPSVVVLGSAWTDFQNLGMTHGFLVTAAAIALLFDARREIAALPAHRSLTGAALLVAGGIVWMVCYRAAIQDLQVAIFPSLIGLAVATAYGWPVAWRMVIPLGLVYTANPAWSQVAEPLQLLTVHAVRALMWMTETPGTASGDTIIIPQGTFAIEGGCSGMHYLVVGIAVALLHGELRRATLRARVILLALMIVLALMANWVRVYVIVVAGYMTGMRSSLLREHYWFGWELFGVALVVFFWLSGRILRRQGETEPPTTPVVTPAARGSSIPVRGLTAAVLLLSFAPVMSSVLKASEREHAAPTAVCIRPSPAWSAAASDPASPWRPEFPGADWVAGGDYRGPDGQAIELFAVAYREQRQGAELVGSETTLLGDGGLREGPEQNISTPLGTFLEAELHDRGGKRSVMWWRYEIGGRNFTDPLASQLWYGLTATVGSPRSALVAFRSECGVSCADARDRMRSFMAYVAISNPPAGDGKDTGCVPPAATQPRLP